jgi:hypothetical protein
MITVSHQTTIGRVAVTVLLAVVLTFPTTTDGQADRKEDSFAFLLYIQSLAAQRTARLCERGEPAYRQKFDDLYARWVAKYGGQVARGEALVRDALARRDQPQADYADLERIEKAAAELRQPPRETSPITLDERGRARCEESLRDLAEGLKP